METKKWSWAKVALLTVFLTQAPLLFITSLPAQIGIWASASDAAPGVGLFGVIGVAAALTGIAFETIGDAQLDRRIQVRTISAHDGLRRADGHESV